MRQRIHIASTRTSCISSSGQACQWMIGFFLSGSYLRKQALMFFFSGPSVSVPGIWRGNARRHLWVCWTRDCACGQATCAFPAVNESIRKNCVWYFKTGVKVSTQNRKWVGFCLTFLVFALCCRLVSVLRNICSCVAPLSDRPTIACEWSITSEWRGDPGRRRHGKNVDASVLQRSQLVPEVFNIQGEKSEENSYLRAT